MNESDDIKWESYQTFAERQFEKFVEYMAADEVEKCTLTADEFAELERTTPL